MKICIFTVSLNTQVTGIDVVAVGLANELVNRGHDVIFISHPGHGESGRLLLDLSIKKFEIHRNYSDKNIQLARSIFLKERPDIVVPMITNSIVSVLVSALYGLDIPLLISEHNNPEKYLNLWWKLGQNYQEKLETRSAIFSAADRIHVLNESFREDLPSFLHDRTIVLKNACPISVETHSDISKKNILFVGRLEQKQKNLKLLIEAFSQLSDKYPGWTLTIAGDGPNANYYKCLARELGVIDKVEFLGHVDDAEPYYLNASIFAIPSYFEGCPMTLIEAQSFGLPSIGLDSCSGVNEMIDDEVNGLLVSKECFAPGLERLMQSESMRNKMSLNALASSKLFDPKSIYDAWERVIVDTVRGCRARGYTRLAEISQICDVDVSKALLSRFLKNNIYWRTYPRVDNAKKWRHLYEDVLKSTSWRITAPIRVARITLGYLRRNGFRAFASRVAVQIKNRVLYSPRVIKLFGRVLPRIDVVGVDIGNMNDVEVLAAHLVKKENVIKNTTNSFFDFLKLARAKVVISAAGAFKKEYSNRAAWVEIWHAAGAIKFFSNRTYKAVNEDHVILSPSEYMRKEYAKAFSTSIDNVLPLGAPKTDICFDKGALEKKKQKFYQSFPELKNKKIYFYAPTYRGKWPDDVELYLDLDFGEVTTKLNEDEIIITKLHPALRVDSQGKRVRKTNIPEQIPGLVDLPEVDTVTLIAVADAVISDYSSIIFEAVLLSKPLICYAEDIERYDLERGLAFDYRKLMPGTLVENSDPDDFLSALRNAAVNPDRYQAFRQQFLSCCDGRAVARLTDLVHRMLDNYDQNLFLDRESIMSST